MVGEHALGWSNQVEKHLNRNGGNSTPTVPIYAVHSPHALRIASTNPQHGYSLPAPGRMAITIPVGRSGHEFIQVGAWELTDDILNILKLEAPPLETWLEVAKGFLAQGRPDAYANVLAASVRQGAAYDDGSRRAVFCRIKILCSLAEYQLQQARLITDAAQKGVATNAAYRTLLMAKELDKAEMLPVLCIGHWQLHKVHSHQHSLAAPVLPAWRQFPPLCPFSPFRSRVSLCAGRSARRTHRVRARLPPAL